MSPTSSRVLNEQTPETVTRVFAHLPFEVAVELLDQPELEASDELLKSLPVEQALALLSAMSDDRAANLFRHVEEPVRSRLLTRLDPAARNSLQQLLAYPPDTAGSLMTTEFVSVPANWTVERTLQHIRDVERTRETVYAIYILEPDTGRLLRALSLRQLISGRRLPSFPSRDLSEHRRRVAGRDSSLSIRHRGRKATAAALCTPIAVTGCSLSQSASGLVK
jgi:magnesium transporter